MADIIPEYPSLLRVDRATKPFEIARGQLQLILGRTSHYETNSIEIKGLFALGIAAFESALSEAYEYMLRCRPEAYRFTKFEVTREEVFRTRSTRDLYERRVQNKVRKDMYGSLRQLLNRYANAAAIDIGTVQQDDIETVLEAKATRNLLMHTNLKANPEYISAAGPAKRSDEPGRQLPITAEYAVSALEACDSVIERLVLLVQAKHADSTNEAVLRRVWTYLFDSPVMKFDDYWEVLDGGSRVYLKESPYEKGLANSEQMILSVWRHHFNAWRVDSRPLNMRSLDEGNQTKVLWFLSVLPELSLG